MKAIDAEFCVIGSMLMSDQYFYGGISLLREDDFATQDIRKIFTHLKSEFTAGKPYEQILVDFPSDIEEIASHSVEYAALSEKMFKAAVRKVIENAKRRKELQIASMLANFEISREEALAALSELDRDRTERGGRVEQVLQRWLEKYEEVLSPEFSPGISTGSIEIDQVFTYRKELSLICARPSIGKTMTALKLLYNQAQMGIKVQFFSLELTEDEVMTRLISIHTREPLRNIVYGWTDFEKVLSAADEIRTLPIYIEPGPLTLPQIKAKIYEIKPDIVYIDYIQKVSQHGSNYRSRKDFLDAVSGELLEIAKTECPIVALAQLNRGARTGRDEPTIEHIKETGNFEQDASNILLLHRNLKETPDVLQVRIAKCRVNAANKEIAIVFKNGIPEFTSPLTGNAFSVGSDEYNDIEF
ncbi:replicative DNA helicase [Desulfurobacterium sp.]